MKLQNPLTARGELFDVAFAKLLWTFVIILVLLYCFLDSFGVRLAGSLQNFQGRLEVNRHGTWGTVCDDNFNDAAARVVCFQLGFG